MATCLIATKPPSFIDYSIDDGSIRVVELYGKTIYDEHYNVINENWEKLLANFLIAEGLYIKGSTGHRRFVEKMLEDGLL